MPASDSELEVLKVLWTRSPLSVREIHEALADATGWAVSTTRTVVERMRSKGALLRSDAHGMAVFEPAQPKVEVLGDSLHHVLRHVLQVPGRLSVSALSGSALLTQDELAELETLLNRRSRKP